MKDAMATSPLARAQTRLLSPCRATGVARFGVALLVCSCSGGEGDPCELEDQDGIIGGEKVVELTLQDEGFEPIILTAQNQADVTLTFQNESSSEAGFTVECLPTPNDEGCAQQSCFPDAATIEPISPGEAATVEFRLPEVEGEYTYRALPAGDDRTGQFIVQ